MNTLKTENKSTVSQSSLKTNHHEILREIRQGLLLAFLAIVLSGCITSGGKNLDVSNIKEGVSTKADVVKLLGPPDHEGTLGNGMSYYQWTSVKVKENLLMGALFSKGIDSTDQERRNSTVGREVQTVEIMFSKEGVVSSMTTNKSGRIE